MKIIVNADDCGISLEVNRAIEDYINRGLLSSTTIMGNMPFIADSKRMFDLYKENISFGIHLNLSEGTPLTKSQILLDKGIYIETDKEPTFNVENKIYNGRFSKEVEDAIFDELSAQIERVLAHGIEFSHIDSHHHVHTRPYMLRIIPRLQKKYKFTKIRRMRNYMPFSLERSKRNAWWYLTKIQSSKLRTTDWFCSFGGFVEFAENGFIKKNSVIELMTHPGGYTKDTEGPLMEKTNLKELFNAQIINYNQL
ncbi:MAG: ChbG/HpnK family deacetylase [Bacteroidaceae bacterium]|nr:ChbG/HpnK family deacetylase [Bacteroidaceae bacterium]